MSDRQKHPKSNWPRIALSVEDHCKEDGSRWVTLEHHATRPSIYTPYRQPKREPKKIDRHGRFTEDADTRMLSEEFGKHVVKNQRGEYFVVQHWGWPPMQITFKSSHLDVIWQGE